MRAISTIFVVPLLASTAFAAIGHMPCISFDSKSGGFPIVANGAGAPIWTDPTDSPSVHRVVQDFVTDIKAVSSVTLKATNYTATSAVKGMPIIVGSYNVPFISKVITATNFNVSGLAGSWETYSAGVVSNPLPGVSKAYLIVGSDRRG